MAGGSKRDEARETTNATKRLLSAEKAISALTVEQRATRRDVIEPLQKTIEKHEERLTAVESRPPPPAHACLRVSDFDEVEGRLQSMSEQMARYGEQITETQRQLRDALEKLTTDVHEGIKTRAIALEAKREVKDAKAHRRSTWIAGAGVAGAFVLAAVSAIYFFGGLSERVASAERGRQASDARVEKQLRELRTGIIADEAADERRILRIEKSIPKGQTASDWYEGLSDEQRRRLKRVLPPSKLPPSRP